jgi:hypothetical protein
MTSPIHNLANLEWTAELPTVTGHYFLWRAEYLRDPMYQIIEMEDGVPSSLDEGWERKYYTADEGYQFLGPVLIQPPLAVRHDAVSAHTNPVQGTNSDV